MVSDEGMTGQEICERYAEFKGVPETEREDWALRFWNASPTGELWHVYVAQEEMIEAGFLR